MGDIKSSSSYDEGPTYPRRLVLDLPVQPETSAITCSCLVLDLASCGDGDDKNDEAMIHTGQIQIVVAACLVRSSSKFLGSC